jgi:hypothetical protein
MTATWACAVSALRRRFGTTLVLVALVGLAGTAALAAWAGSRRTATAFPRFLAATHAADAIVDDSALGPLDDDVVAAVPGVRAAAAVHGYGALLVDDRGRPSFVEQGLFAIVGHHGALRSISAPHVVEGRLPDPARADEAAVTQDVLDLTGLEVGDHLQFLTFEFAAIEEAGQARLAELEAEGREPTEEDYVQVYQEQGRAKEVEVTGLGRSPEEIVTSSDEESEGFAGIMLTPAFAREVGVDPSYEILHVDLADPAGDLAALQSVVRTAHPDAVINVTSRLEREAVVQDAARPYIDSLRLFAVVLGATAVLILGQALARQAIADAADAPTLVAVGMTPWQIRMAATARGVVIAAAGAALAVAGAVAASPLFPVGPVRAAEPDPGVHLDPLAVLACAALVVLAGGVAALLGSLRATSTAAVAGRPSRLVERLGAAGAPPSTVIGVRAALEPRPASGAPLSATLVGTTMAVVALTAALAFGAGLSRLVSEPDRYGWRWDGLFDTFEGGLGEEQAAELAADPDLASVDLGARASVSLEGTPVPAVGLEARKGQVLLDVTGGAFPVAPDEVALGPRTRRRLDVDMGDRVQAIDASGETVSLRVVGEALFPALSLGTTTALGDGAAFTMAGLEALAGLDVSFALVDLAPGVPFDRVVARYEEAGELFGPQQPGEIVSYDRVRRVPLLLTAVLAALGIGVLGHALVVALRQQRRDHAVLRILGFRRRQVSAAVAWQATTLAVVSLAVGVPLGLVAGRLAWRAFTTDLGAGGPPVTPVLAVAAVVVGGLVLANVLAAVPALRAGRLRPALVLRTE